jgi:hypothetical protein
VRVRSTITEDTFEKGTSGPVWDANGHELPPYRPLGFPSGWS